jgi:hypothetical protein
MKPRRQPANDVELPRVATHAERRIGPRAAPIEGHAGPPLSARPGDALVSGVLDAHVEELIVELARFCAELMFHEQFSAEPANDDS